MIFELCQDFGVCQDFGALRLSASLERNARKKDTSRWDSSQIDVTDFDRRCGGNKKPEEGKSSGLPVGRVWGVLGGFMMK